MEEWTERKREDAMSSRFCLCMISALSVPMYADRAKIPQSRGPSLPKAHTLLQVGCVFFLFCPMQLDANMNGNGHVTDTVT